MSLGVGLFDSAVRANKGNAVDVTAPARVIDFALVGPPAAGVAQFGWTAAGDDSFTGVAAQWDMRWSPSVITGGSWEAATSIFGGWAANSVAGGSATEHSVVDVGSVPVRFAVRYRDEAGNMGLVSNNAEVTAWQ